MGPHRWFDLSVSRSDDGTNHWVSVVTSDGTPMYVWIGDSDAVNAKFIPTDEPPHVLRLKRGGDEMYQLVGPMDSE